MSHISEYIVKFDLLLSRHNNVSFSYDEIDLLLQRVTNNVRIQKECLDFFVKNGILQKNDYSYYYLSDKCYRDQRYKNYTKLKTIINNDLYSNLDFTNFNL